MINPRTIEIELTAPWVGFLKSLSSGLAPIFSRADYLQDKRLTSSGPYQLQSQNNEWILQPYRLYKGMFPPQSFSFKILTAPSNDKPDIVLRKFKGPSQLTGYNKTEIDSFTTYNFMVNPRAHLWKDKNNRLQLIRLMMDARRIITNPSLTDLRDVIPKGMLGHDIAGNSYSDLVTKLPEIDFRNFPSRRIVVASLGHITGFSDFSKYARETYGIEVVNTAVEGEGYLSKLRAIANADIYAVGWTSIFSHPDATFIPFYLLGIDQFDVETETLLTKISNTNNLRIQYEFYRELSSHLVSQGYILPHAQANTLLYIRSDLSTPKLRYRYTIQLSEIKNRVAKHGKKYRS